ncbi:MAG: ABC transporter permease [Eubacteriales bacterium]|nr:ABC transporter permease [Eubacteriales bacterium]
MANQNQAAMTITEEFSAKVHRDNQMERVMKIAPMLVLVLLIAVFGIACGSNFFSGSNFISIMNQLAIPMIIAFGLTFVIMIGSIDLSINGTVGMAGSLCAVFVLNNQFAQFNMGIWGAVLAVLASTVIGLIIGMIHVKLLIPSFMVTFAFMYICRGIGMLSYQGHPPTILDPVFVALPKLTLLGIPFITWIAILMLLLCWFIQEYTAFGRYIYAVGTNESIPRSVGVNVDLVKVKVFTLAGFLFGVAGVLGAIRLGQGQVGIGDDMMFPAQAAVVIGGTSLAGGKGGVINTIVGVLIMTVLNNGLLLLGVNPYVRTGIQGLIILIAVILTIPKGGKIISK